MSRGSMDQCVHLCESAFADLSPPGCTSSARQHRRAHPCHETEYTIFLPSGREVHDKCLLPEAPRHAPPPSTRQTVTMIDLIWRSFKYAAIHLYGSALHSSRKGLQGIVPCCSPKLPAL